jgi:3'-phosphoadenosine 5'-phosphosulfate synthase
VEDELMVPPSKRDARLAEAATLPKALLTDIDVNWLQVVGEGWAAPLKGFMREGPLLQALHFNSLLADTWNATGAAGLSERQTDWNDYTTRARERVSMAVMMRLVIKL